MQKSQITDLEGKSQLPTTDNHSPKRWPPPWSMTLRIYCMAGKERGHRWDNCSTERRRVQAAYRMIPDFHSRKSAHSRIYQYRIFNRQWPSPLGRHSSYWVRAPLDVDRMAAAAKHLVGSHDFRALAPGFGADRSAIRTVYRWEVRREDDTVVIECEANGFLRHQIRRTNALLIEIGKGRWPGDLVNQVLDDRGSEKIEWTSAPACGLCLMKVSYPNFWSQVYTEDETD